MLRLSPEAFWAMTPGEFHAALDGWREATGRKDHPLAPPTRAEIDAMMARFPD